jgi:hypothetical protein
LNSNVLRFFDAGGVFGLQDMAETAMSSFLHGGIGLGDNGEFVRFYVNVDGRVYTCQIGRAALNRLANADASGEDLFDQFMEAEDEIVDLAAKAIANGASTDPIVVDVP